MCCCSPLIFRGGVGSFRGAFVLFSSGCDDDDDAFDSYTSRFDLGSLFDSSFVAVGALI